MIFSSCAVEKCIHMFTERQYVESLTHEILSKCSQRQCLLAELFQTNQNKRGNFVIKSPSLDKAYHFSYFR